MELDKKYTWTRDALFFLICACVVFDNIPKAIQFNFLGGPLGAQLGVYAIFAGFVFTLIAIYKKRMDWKNRSVILFFILYLLVLLASSIHGLIIYPYYDQIFNAPVVQIEKLPRMLSFFHNHGIFVSEKNVLGIWIVVRSIKGDFFNLLYTFGMSYMLFLWYQGDLDSAWKILKKGVLASLTVFILYGFIDVAFQMGVSPARYILETVNPLLHPIAATHDWWPPLLWKGQLRSVLCEPSRVGNYISFVLPLLFIPILNKSQHWKIYLVISGILSYMVFMTKARTSVSMLLGIFFLTVILLVCLRKKIYIKRITRITFVMVVAFGLSMVSISGFYKTNEQENVQYNKVVQGYFEDNVGSLATNDKRSNRARYALIKSNIRTGTEYPILGVGRLLNGAYTVANFDEFDVQSNEVQKWVKDYYAEGPLKNNFDAMNAYISCFSMTGILGLICLLLPYFYVLIRLGRTILRCKESTLKIRLLGLFIALIASMVAGCNGSLTLVYAAWILLALAYIAVTEVKSKEKKNSESA